MELNERQEALYKYLNIMSFTNDYISKEQIAGRLYDYYPRYSETSNEHNSTVFAALRHDVRAINFSGVEKIIVSSNKGYKIATKEEAEAYIKRRLKSSLVSLKLYWTIKNKMDLDQQLDMDLKRIETYVS